MIQASTGRPKALVLGPAFFGYERDIVSELRKQGYDAEFLDERPSNGSLTRAILRVRKALIARRIILHFEAALERLSEKSYELVLVIKGEVVPRWFLEDLRRQSPTARFVFYTYDSLSNSANCVQLLDCFDERFTFDRDDVVERPGLSYLPLFYTSEFAPLSPAEYPRPRRKHDLTFVGTLHSQRYGFVKALLSGRDRTFVFFFAQARWYFALVKYVTREHRSVSWKEVSFTPMAKRDIAEVFRESRAVLDMQRSGQSGLTMRTFEVLASGAILVTTNAAIKQEPFYDPARIIVVPPDLALLDADRIGSELDALKPPDGLPAGFEAYSLSAWVCTVVGADERRRRVVIARHHE